MTFTSTLYFPYLKRSAQVVLFALLYVVAAELGSHLSFMPSKAATFWPPSGLIVAALIAASPRTGFYLLIAVIPGNVLLSALHGQSLVLSCGYALGNVLEAMAGASLVRRFSRGRKTLVGSRDVAVLFLGSALVSTLIGAANGAALQALYIPNTSFREVFRLWWAGHALGVMIFAPVVLIWAGTPLKMQRRIIASRRFWEGAAIIVVELAIGWYVFIAQSRGFIGQGLLMTLPVYWAAFRFHLRFVSVVSLIQALILIGSTSHGLGSAAFASEPIAAQASALQLFVGLSMFMGYAISGFVTEQRQASNALRASEARFRRVIENIQDALIVDDKDGRIVFANDQFLRLFGFERADLGAIVLENYVAPEWKKILRERHDSRLRGEKVPENFEYEGIRKDGRHLWLEVNVVPMHDSQGSLTGTQSTIRDITERKTMAMNLMRSEQRLRATFDKAPLGIVEVGADNHFIAVNQRICQMLGYTREELLGMTISELTVEEDRALSERMNGSLRAPGQDVVAYEKRYRMKSGAPLWVNVTVAALRDQQGTLTGIIGTVEDITERRRIADELRSLNEELDHRVRERTMQLETANQELESFSYSVSHDLRAPLRGIDGWSLALLEDYGSELNDEARGYITRVRTESGRMSELIDDLLRLSRVSRTEIVRTEVDLSAAASRIVVRLQESDPARKVNVTVEKGLSASGDRQLLDAALENLLSNAWKFTARRDIATIEIGRTESGGCVAFFVRDNGAGFDMAHAGKLFSPFQRMHRQSDFPGTGIGLATVQRIIHRHGGRIWAESQIGSGSTFYFTI